jgi:hypothetical protein
MTEILITVKELSDIIKFSPRAIYNKIHRKEFKENVHYYKPSKRKVLFIWPRIKEWLEGTHKTCQPESTKGMTIGKSLINI